MATQYSINTDVKFGPLELVDVKALVVEGRFLIDLEGRSVELRPGQGFMVPRGVMHCTRAPERSVVLMIEAATVKPTGD